MHCIVGADRAKVLAGIRRALRPGGLLFSETMTCEPPFEAASFLADPVTRVALNGTRVWVSRQEYERELAGAGFVIEQSELRPNPPGDPIDLVVIARS
jgi:hypothetical protein